MVDMKYVVIKFSENKRITEYNKGTVTSAESSENNKVPEVSKENNTEK